MDAEAAAPSSVDADLGKIFGLFINVDDQDLPTTPKQRNTVIKFTRIPAHDLVNKAWPQPRIRRIVTLEDQLLQSSRSLKINMAPPEVTSSHTQRKIVTIAEDDENDLHPRFSKDGKRSSTARSNRAIQAQEVKQTRSLSHRPSSGVTSAKFPNDKKQGAKLNNALIKKDMNNTCSVRTKNVSAPSQKSEECNNKSNQTVKEKVSVRSSNSNTPLNSISRTHSRTTRPSPSEKIITIKNKLQNNEKPPARPKPKIKDGISTNRSVDIIRVPIENRFKAKQNNTEKAAADNRMEKKLKEIKLTDNSTETEIRCYKDAEVITELPEKIDRESFTGDMEFDSLNIPDVSLTNKSELVSLISKSLPELKVPDSNLSLKKAASYIIGQATLTLTTKQKINFHVVNSDIAPYPMNVVSVFRNEKKTCSGSKLKPTNVISAIRMNKELLPRESLTEQFEREVNFIDSFLESLQYLEGLEKGLGLSDQCVSDAELKMDFSDGDFLSRLETSAADDPDAVASKSLCLLNLLIRDEQRRAKNLLLVLKMREDALKDFTKSHILYLENKKKQENIDISALKKKQRGALLKLQHECGEMQRMRKALLTMSEKRKSALMKTKKSIELKLGNVPLEKMISKKKPRKLAERTSPLKCFDLSSSEEVPKSVELMTSSAEFQKTAAEEFVVVDGGYLNILFQNLHLPQIFSSGKQYEVNEEALKNILSSANSQLDFSDSDLIAKFVDQLVHDRASSPSTARSLVEEFDQYYKVLNKDGDSRQESESHESVSCEAPEPYVEGPTAGPLPGPPGAPADGSQESLAWRSTSDSSDTSSDTAVASTQISTPYPVQSIPCIEDYISCTEDSNTTLPDLFTSLPSLPDAITSLPSLRTSLPCQETTLPCQETSLPCQETSFPCQEISFPCLEKSVASQHSPTPSPVESLVSVVESLPSVVDCEAERLRRQQLAIEREIKALEQQQNLLIVREIPDKPPPPYTPPGDPRAPAPSRKFLPGEDSEGRIEKLLEGEGCEGGSEADAFDVFLSDYCGEVVEREKAEKSDKPWDACNLLPIKAAPRESLARRTLKELSDLLAGATVATVSGLGTRRSDSIDDILLAEWRRREAEWTNLHAEEAAVKNQLFEAIFESLIEETTEEYKEIFSL